MKRTRCVFSLLSLAVIHCLQPQHLMLCTLEAGETWSGNWIHKMLKTSSTDREQAHSINFNKPPPP